MTRSHSTNALVFIALVVLAAASRFVEAAPNFAAVAAVALFAGVFFSNRLLAMAVPVVAMLISDLGHGFYDARQMVVVYACLALPVLFRSFIAPVGRPAMLRAIGAAAVCSVAFFAFTNLAVWAFGSAYTHDLNGFALCYAKALPFFRFTIAGDLAYTGAIFGAYLLMTRAAAHRAVVATA